MRIHAIRAHAHSGGGHEAIARTDGLIWICQQQHHDWIEAFLVSHREVRSANSFIKRRTNVVGIFPNDDAITRLVGSQRLEQQEEWQIERRRFFVDQWS